MQRAHRVEAVDRQLVERHQVLALRIHGVAFHGHQVTNVVMHAQLVEHLAFAVIPLGHLRIDVQRRVSHARFSIVLRVQGAEPQFDLGMQRILHRDHGNAVRILRFELAGLDGGHDLLEAVDRHVGVELARHDHVLAVRRHVHTVRTLRLRHQEQNALLDRQLDGDHVVAVDLGGLAGLDQLGSLLPVRHVQVVGVLGGAAGFIRRTAFLDPAHIALGAERVGEAPAFRRALARIGQILRIRRQLEGEGLFRDDPAFMAVELPVGHTTAILLVELGQRLELLVGQRRSVLRSLHHVLGVRRHEGPAVLRLVDRVHHDLLGLEVTQVDHRQTRVGLVVDEQELAVVLTFGFGNRRVVRIAPGDLLAVDHALLEHALGALVEAVALPGFRRKHGDVLEDAHGRNAIHDDLATLAAGAEGEELIALARGHIGFGRRHEVLLGQPAALHHVLQRLGGKRRGRRRQTEASRKRQTNRLLDTCLHNCSLPEQ